MIYTKTLSDTIDALHRGEKVYKAGLYLALQQTDNAFSRRLVEAVRNLESEQATRRREEENMTWEEFIGEAS